MLNNDDISRLIPAGLLGTQWQAIKDFARAIEAPAGVTIKCLQRGNDD